MRSATLSSCWAWVAAALLSAGCTAHPVSSSSATGGAGTIAATSTGTASATATSSSATSAATTASASSGMAATSSGGSLGSTAAGSSGSTRGASSGSPASSSSSSVSASSSSGSPGNAICDPCNTTADCAAGLYCDRNQRCNQATCGAACTARGDRCDPIDGGCGCVGPGFDLCVGGCISYLQCNSNFCDAQGYCNIQSCLTNADCGGQSCDPRTGQCQCGLLLACGLCGADADCASGFCDALHHCNVSDCGASNACSASGNACDADAGRCDCSFDGGFCYVCYTDLDCAAGLHCLGGYCTAIPCSSTPCIAYGASCDEDGGPCNCLPN